MKRANLIFMLGLFCLPGSSIAQEVDDLKAICNRIERRHSIKVYVDQCPATTWKIDYSFATEEDDKKLSRYITKFENEFRKYPQAFLKNTKLKAVVFVKSLAIQKQFRAAIPDYGKEILILDFLRGAHSPVYQTHVIHHEFYHMIEEELNHDVYWKDPDWAKLNKPGTKYGKGGIHVQGNRNMYAFAHPEQGFVNLYSKSAIEEDKAEIFAALFTPEEYRCVEKWAKTDRFLFKKIEYMKRFLSQCDPAFDTQFWRKLHQTLHTPEASKCAD